MSDTTRRNIGFSGSVTTTVPCTASRTIKGFKFPCWYRYEEGHGWDEEPHQHWFVMIDDQGNETTVTWTTPVGPSGGPDE